MNEAICNLCGISFSPTLKNALSQHLRTCPETLFTGGPNDQGRGSLLTCGDIEQNPGPQYPEHEQRDTCPPGNNLPEALLGIFADAAPGTGPPVLVDNNTGRPLSDPPPISAHLTSFTASFLHQDNVSGIPRPMEIDLPGSCRPPHPSLQRTRLSGARRDGRMYPGNPETVSPGLRGPTDEFFGC